KLEEAPMSALDVLEEKLSGKNVKNVVPEGEDERLLTAATQLQSTDNMTPEVLGNDASITAFAADNGLDMSNLEMMHAEQSESKQELVTAFVERREGKATEEQAQEMLKNVN